MCRKTNKYQMRKDWVKRMSELDNRSGELFPCAKGGVT